jgi:hypothetical protein
MSGWLQLRIAGRQSHERDDTPEHIAKNQIAQGRSAETIRKHMKR